MRHARNEKQLFWAEITQAHHQLLETFLFYQKIYFDES